MRCQLAFVVVAVLGCNKHNPNFCPGAPDNNCAELDGAPDMSMACTKDEQCTDDPDKTVCDGKECVQCTPQEDKCDKASTAPVCVDNACAGCRVHPECTTSKACLPDGSCAVDTAVAYVSASGTDNDMCTLAMPCTKMQKALATGRHIIKVTGTITENVTISNGAVVTIIADPDGELTSTNGITLLVRDDNTNVTIRDLSISDSTSTSGIGVVIPLASGSPTLTMDRVKVLHNPGGGIITQGGTLVLKQSTIANNLGGGIQISMAGKFTIVNNMIAENGNAATGGTNFGGVELTSNTNGNRFEFNSVAYNHARVGATSGPGVGCSVPSLIAGNNIISSNNEGTSFTAQTRGTCGFGNSYTSPDSQANTLGFASTTSDPPDLHLTGVSPTTVVNAGGVCSDVDIDDQKRPINGMCDLGADEFKPPM